MRRPMVTRSLHFKKNTKFATVGLPHRENNDCVSFFCRDLSEKHRSIGNNAFSFYSKKHFELKMRA